MKCLKETHFSAYLYVQANLILHDSHLFADALTTVTFKCSSDLYKLTLTLRNTKIEWSKMDAKLKTPRGNFVASLIPA